MSDDPEGIRDDLALLGMSEAQRTHAMLCALVNWMRLSGRLTPADEAALAAEIRAVMTPPLPAHLPAAEQAAWRAAAHRLAQKALAQAGLPEADPARPGPPAGR